MAKARLYKMVTPPKIKGGLTIQVGGKTVTGASEGMTSLIKATNSIGATTNSIAIIVEKMNKTFADNMQMQIQQQQDLADQREAGVEKLVTQRKEEQEDLERQKDLEDDLDAENLQETKPKKGGGLAYSAGEVAGAAVSNAFGFFQGIAKFIANAFKTMLTYAVLKWMGNPENQKKLQKLISGIARIGKWLAKIAGFLITMGLDGLTDFIKNPISFKGIFGILKFLTAAAIFFAPVKMAKFGLKAVMSLFKGGKLFKLIGGMLKGLMGVFKGILGFIMMRPRAALMIGGALLAAWGLKKVMSKDDEEKEGEDGGKGDKDQESLDPEQEYERWRKNYDASNTRIVTQDGQELKEGDDGFEEALKESRTKFIEMMNKANNKDEKAIGGEVDKPDVALPKFAAGGWIQGPQTGYPVSLDGGRSTSFIGHGTEYVARKKSGGAFVVPYDTPATRGNSALTGRRQKEAADKGYALPSFSSGGLIKGMAAGGPTPELGKMSTKELVEAAAPSLIAFMKQHNELIDSDPEFFGSHMRIEMDRDGKMPNFGKTVANMSEWAFNEGVNMIETNEAIEAEVKEQLLKKMAWIRRQTLDNPNFKSDLAFDLNKEIPGTAAYRLYEKAKNSPKNIAIKAGIPPEEVARLWNRRGKSQGGVVQHQPVHLDMGGVVPTPHQDTNGMSTGDFIDVDSMVEEEEAAGNEVNVTNGDLAPINLGGGQNKTDITPPKPIFIDNKYEPPANDFFRTRYGMMAESNTPPVEMF